MARVPRILTKAVGAALRATRLEHLPVRVRAGVAKGARWTLYPWTSYWRGTYELPNQRLLTELGGGSIEGWSCWDLGAHFGLYSVGLAMRVGPRGQVAAFEPNPVSFARLDRHRRMNGLAQLKVYQAAVSDSARSDQLITEGNLGSTETHLRYEGEREAGSDAVSIRTLALDTLVDAGELRDPDFVKMDVEGHGHRALAGAARSLARKRPILLVSIHSPAEDAGVRAILEPLGYRSEVTASGDNLLFTPAA